MIFRHEAKTIEVNGAVRPDSARVMFQVIEQLTFVINDFCHELGKSFKKLERALMDFGNAIRQNAEEQQ